jgi:hypothetical protein
MQKTSGGRRIATVATVVASIAALVMSATPSSAHVTSGERATGTARMAAAHPVVKIAIAHRRVTGGAPLSIRWRAAHVPAGSAVVLQRRPDSSTAWKRLRVLHGNHGKVTLHAVRQGRMLYSVAVVRRHHAVKRATKAVFAYKQMKLSDLVSYYSDYTTTINGEVFVYATEQNALNASASLQTWVGSGATTSCRWVRWSVAAGPTVDDGAELPKMVFSRAAGATKRINLELEHVYRTHRLATGGKAFAAAFTKDYGYSLYLNAQLSCYTATGSTT